MSARQEDQKGPLAWFARNSVAANTILIVLLVGGLISIPRIDQEVFPDIEVEMVTIEITYPGASPQEVEQGVIQATEEAVRGLDGVRSIESVADEGVGVVALEMVLGADPDRMLSDVENAVSRVSYPADVEPPIISLPAIRLLVLSIAVIGPDDEELLRRQAERLRAHLLDDDGVSLVELSAVRPREMAIEVSADDLEKHGMTLEEVAARVRAGALDLPGGELVTKRGDVLVRTTERADYREDFEGIVVLADSSGSAVTVGDMATVMDGFEDTGRAAFFDGRRAVLLDVYRVGEETPLEVASAAREAKRAFLASEPPVELFVWQDSSVLFSDRVRLLFRNGLIGLCLILVILGIFLELKLAFWVMVGLAAAFIGALLLLPGLDVSINVVSLFAFIVALGLVIDDAIVVGEAVHYYRQKGLGLLAASIAGVREMVMPVTFAVVTTALAFAPLLFVPGFAGRIYENIPLIVISVLAISLIEAFFILPAHLAHSRPPRPGGALEWIERKKKVVADGLSSFIDCCYLPASRWIVSRRYLTLTSFFALLLVTGALLVGGRIAFIFMPDIESDTAAALLEMPFGSPRDDTQRGMRLLEDEARSLLEERGWEQYHRGVFSQIGSLTVTAPARVAARPEVGTHLAEVAVELVPSGERPFSAEELSRLWRERVGEIEGAVQLTYVHQAAHAGRPIAIELVHPDEEKMEAAAVALSRVLETYSGVRDVDAGLARGKTQLDLKLLPAGKALGLTAADMAEQVRSAFFGAEAARQQRERDEVTVRVRLPAEERASISDVDNLLLRAPDGGSVPLRMVASIRESEGYSRLMRRDGRRVIEVSADTDPAVTDAGVVTSELMGDVLPELEERWPGLRYSLAGQQEAQREATGDLLGLFLLALIAMFGILAIALGSFVQPVIILLAIPFGMIGAVVGHLLLGYDFSIISLMGIVALSGVVVNSSLLLITTINRARAEGQEVEDAVCHGCARRFRPVILTTLTTFFGLAPLIFDPSEAAQFLVPMAISLGFGILFGSGITLMLVPSAYFVVEDARALLGRWRRATE